jgi:hypothetical protein
LDLSLRARPSWFVFKLAEPQSPFLVSVAFMAGGGYLGLELGTDGVKALEAALEFGAAFAFVLGPVRGAVKAVGGIFLRIETGRGCLSRIYASPGT